jgi:putative membrane protein
MIHAFSDHAANERTFLAWVRTGIAVIAFGFVIERFNLFLIAVAGSAPLQAAERVRIDRLSGPLGRYDGFALIVAGFAIIVLAALRFVRTGRLIDDTQTHTSEGLRAELILSAAIVVAVAGFSVFLVLG